MPLITTPGRMARYAEFYHQLGSMISAGMPLIKALDMAGKRPRTGLSSTAIHQIIHNLQAGQTFTESLSHTEGWLPEFDRSLLSVGESAGRLDVAFKQLATYYTTRAKIIRDTISGLIMTVATLHVFLLIMPLPLLVAFVMGILNNDYKQCIPFIIEKIAVFGILYLSVFFLIFASQGQRSEVWRSFVESIFDWVPMLGTARRYLTLSRLSAALEALVSSGISIVQGWDMAAAAAGSPRLRKEIAGWRSHIASGSTPGEMVNQSTYFPEMYANFYFTGEQSGQLDESLRRLQAYYQDEGFRKLTFFTRIMNGIIYGIIAFSVAVFIIHFYVSYFNSAVNAF